MEQKEYLKNIALNGSPQEKRELFAFDNNTAPEKILKKYKYFSRACFPHYFTHKSAPHHDDRAMNYIHSYIGDQNVIEIAYRGDAKTAHLKLFDTFVILNDQNHRRKYIKVLSRDLKNAVQFVTDIYNNIVILNHIYGDVFEKQGNVKREERMGSFTTKDKVKLVAGTVGQTQRGHLQDAFRPDWVQFEDIEDRESISSIAITEGVIKKCDEAIQGLSFDGNYVVNGNYISDAGTVQWFLDKPKIHKHIVPIINDNGEPYWARYTPDKIEQLKSDTDDWAGEYLCDPMRSGDKFFDVVKVRRLLAEAEQYKHKVGTLRYWSDYQAHHRYGIGVDLSDGVGKDSCAIVMFDFTAGEQVVSADSNEIAPDLFTYEAIKAGREFGNCILAPEVNNTCGGIAIRVLKEESYPHIYQKEITDSVNNVLTKRLGWHTNSKTKPNMFYEFRKDFNDGLVKINDERILKEMLAFTLSDLQDTTKSAITRHFDLLTATCIAWQMKDLATQGEEVKNFYKNLQGKKRKAVA